MKTKMLIVSLMVATVLIPTQKALAHHGYAAYDMTRMVTVRGTVAAFEWVNPHSILTLSSRGDKGQDQKWFVAAGPATMLERCGWSSNGHSSGSLVKGGDQVTVVGFRARSGANMMILFRLTLPDGKQLSASCEK